MMEKMRNNLPTNIGKYKVVSISDYQLKKYKNSLDVESFLESYENLYKTL